MTKTTLVYWRFVTMIVTFQSRIRFYSAKFCFLQNKSWFVQNEKLLRRLCIGQNFCQKSHILYKWPNLGIKISGFRIRAILMPENGCEVGKARVFRPFPPNTAKVNTIFTLRAKTSSPPKRKFTSMVFANVPMTCYFLYFLSTWRPARTFAN